MRVAYLCLQPRSGTGASDTHVDGIVGGLRHLGIEVELIEMRTSSESLLVRLLLGVVLQVRHVRELRSADAVYARMHPTTALLPWLIGRSPLLVEVNGVPEDYVVVHPRLRRVAGLVRRGIRRLLIRADHVIVVTPGLGKRVQAWVPSAATVVVPNAADPERFRPDLPRPADLPDERYVIFFGALAPWQGLELAVQAAQHPDWPSGLRLVIIGDGPQRSLAERAAAEAPERITYLGPRSSNEVPAYVANADLSLCLKQYHDVVAGQSPLKLYESTVAGTPVLATPLHGCTDVDAVAPLVTKVLPTVAGVVAGVRANGNSEAARTQCASETLGRVRREQTWLARSADIRELIELAAGPHPATGGQPPKDAR